LHGGDGNNFGGHAYLRGGNAGSGGGNVEIQGGNGEAPGSISLQAGTSSMSNLGYIFLRALPTSDPHIAEALWNDSGVLKISAG
jgi:hypothetical protein